MQFFLHISIYVTKKEQNFRILWKVYEKFKIKSKVERSLTVKDLTKMWNPHMYNKIARYDLWWLIWQKQVLIKKKTIIRYTKPVHIFYNFTKQSTNSITKRSKSSNFIAFLTVGTYPKLKVTALHT